MAFRHVILLSSEPPSTGEAGTSSRNSPCPIAVSLCVAASPRNPDSWLPCQLIFMPRPRYCKRSAFFFLSGSRVLSVGIAGDRERTEVEGTELRRGRTTTVEIQRQSMLNPPMLQAHPFACPWQGPVPFSLQIGVPWFSAWQRFSVPRSLLRVCPFPLYHHLHSLSGR